MNLSDLENAVELAPKTGRQPAIFIGHGSPMNIIRDNAFTRSLRELGERHGRPAAVLVISAHWLTRGETRVSVNPVPPTIHDFGGFPEELYRLRYPAPGQPLIARGVADEVTSIRVHEDHEMGLDHGAWGILRHLWPDASVPVFQMSIDYDKPPGWHHELGQQLRRLRERGVLVLGSGNVVHNLRRISWDESDPRVPSWALEFDAWVKDRLEQGDHVALFDYAKLGETARLAVPTNDHYLPMLYTLGAMLPGENIRFTHESFQNGSISMRCFEAA
ncbi:4,5-DOPA dioxygenase extradiol [Luteolibacter sp. LG18]|uniref:4,5-DOPA-extradiol-dioxygenase n=1 Tax=Luteolibacter sp. LG18 TaxID=2819286 RepID=UPI002B2A6163|nr:dioxygenase [Luteolibacter sp. LG18]